MDYTFGTDLVKHQWDAIHDPGLVVGMFERDEEGALVIFPCKTDKPLINGTGEGQSQIVKGSKFIPNGYGGTNVPCEESYYYHIEDKTYNACCDENGKDVTVESKYKTDWYSEEKYCKDVIKPVLESCGILNGQISCLHPESSRISAGYNLEQFFKDRPVSDDFLKILGTSYYSEICRDATSRLSGSGSIDRVYIEFDIILTFTGVGEVRALINYLRAKSFSQGAKLFASKTANGVEILAREGGERVAIYTEGALKEIRFIDEGGEILGTTGKIKFLNNEGKQAESVFQLIRKDGQIGLRKVISNTGNLPSVIRELLSRPSYKPFRSVFSKFNKTTTFIGKWDEVVGGQQNGLKKVFEELSENDLNIYMQSGKFDHPGGFNVLSIDNFPSKRVEYALKMDAGQINSSWTFDDYIWEVYDKPWLESALQRGDDVIIWSDPINSRTGFYKRELDLIQSKASQFGYDYNTGIGSGTFSK